jgi:hypothetical protein
MKYVAFGLAVIVGTASACTVKTTSDADRFREPIPQGGEVALKVPGSAGAATTTSSSAIRVESTPTSGAPGTTGTSGTAEYYRFTRDLTDAVDWGSAATVGLVWLIVQAPPTSTSAHQAVWGPARGEALSPVTWKLTVNETTTDVFNYQLDGRPNASTSDADWKTVLAGHGYAKASASHATGWFQWDADAQRALDPMRAANDTGTTKVTYDVRTLPATLRAEHAPTASTESSYTIDVTHLTGGAGQVDIAALGDLDPSGTTAKENVDMHSRWDASGAGRADTTVAGGDVPVSIASVHATECWDTSFARVYYTDTASTQPTTGSPSACAFSQVIQAYASQ